MTLWDEAKRLGTPCQSNGKRDLVRLLVALVIVSLVLTFGAKRRDPSVRLDHTFGREQNVSLVVVSDSRFSARYNTQAKSIECYARQHGYSFVRLSPELDAPLCKSNLASFFFQKHCTVSHWLRTQPSDLAAVVLDGDVIGGTSNKSLAMWLKYDFDVAFYERCWNFEITSGNYIVRNTPFGQHFLLHWANYDKKQPRGFSSADNGAIHLAVLEALAISGREKCYDIYRALDETSTVTNLTSYFQYVGCTRRLLGPPRTHIATVYAGDTGSLLSEKDNTKQRPVGAITIFPRFFGIAVDPLVHGFTGFRNLHPFHHGLKSETWWKDYVDYKDFDNFTSCKEFSRNRTISDKDMGERLRIADNYAMTDKSLDHETIPRWEQADAKCYDKLWCEPLPSKVKDWPRGMVFSNGTLEQFTYKDPGRDWYNEFANGVDNRAAT